MKTAKTHNKPLKCPGCGKTAKQSFFIQEVSTHANQYEFDGWDADGNAILGDCFSTDSDTDHLEVVCSECGIVIE